MTTVLRVKARWGGFTGAPGFSVFHFRDFSQESFTNADATNAASRVRTFFEAVAPWMPTGVTVQVEQDTEVIGIDSGQMEGIMTAGPQQLVSGTANAAAGYAAAAGAVVTWRTSTVKNGRRMRGRTFLVPLSSSAFESNGTLQQGTINSILGAAPQLRESATGPELGVYARPPQGGGTGLFAPVSSYSVPDMGAILRSRRD